jgi:hypothetical protein
MATIKKAQSGKTLKPNYSNIKGKGWESLKTPTSKDSSDYREGFDTKLKGETIKQYPSPSGAKVRGYNEASKRNQEIINEKTAKYLKEKEKKSYSNERANKVVGKTSKAKDGKWIQKVSKSIKARGTEGKCTPITKPGCTGRAKALAKTFKRIAAKRKAK